jgi:peptidoglycan/LPS O-acetylase OafA/YrhL
VAKHFGALDLYRFIAAFGVAALHFAQMSKYDPEYGFGYAVGNFALFVDFFFILSGFVIGLTYSDSVSTAAGIFTFLRRRIARIYPLYLLTLLAFMAPALFGFSRNPDKWTTASILSDVLLVKNWPVPSQLPFNFPAWSISVEWAMYLAFPLIMVLYRRAGMWALAALIVLGLAGLEYTIYAGLTDIPSWFGNISPIRALPTFCAGILISQTYDRVKIKNALWWGLSSFLLAILLMMLHANNYLAVSVVFVATFLTANAYVSAPKTVLDHPVFLTLGDASYSVYMWHAFFFTAFLDFLWPRISTGQPTLWYGAIVALGLVMFSVASYRLFERPARNFISGRKRF